MHMHIDICLRSRQLKPLPNLLFVKQNSNTFLFIVFVSDVWP